MLDTIGLWELRAADKACFERELDNIVPAKVYDMHAHLWRVQDFDGAPPPFIAAGPPEITLETYREHIALILPAREVHGMHFPFPATHPLDPRPMNDWIAEQLPLDSLARGQYYVRPDDDPEQVREDMKRRGFTGFKPFANFAARPDKQHATIPEFMPEWIPRMAHEEGWTITLHLQRARSLADASNLHWIQEYCTKYPDMVLILDHCARGFNPYHLIEGLQALPTLDNLYVDTSVNCSPLAILACVQLLGVNRMFYGSDFYCSHQRGTNLAVGDSFMWLDDSAPQWQTDEDVLYRGKPLLVGLENLRAIAAVFRMLRVGEDGIEAFFWGNAARVMAL